MSIRKTFTLRMEVEMLEKLHFIASKNRRSANNQIEILVENLIDAYEKENGEILLPDSQV